MLSPDLTEPGSHGWQIIPVLLGDLCVSGADFEVSHNAEVSPLTPKNRVLAKHAFVIPSL